MIYNLPMLANLEDLREMTKLLGYLLFLRKERPEGARFNMKEKFEYFGVFWGTALLAMTGILMWANAEASRYLPGRLLTVANLVHGFEAYLALLHVGILHLVGVLFSPSVFPMSRAMVTGETPPEEIAEAHSRMIFEAEESLKLEAQHWRAGNRLWKDARETPLQTQKRRPVRRTRQGTQGIRQGRACPGRLEDSWFDSMLSRSCSWFSGPVMWRFNISMFRSSCRRRCRIAT